MCQANVLASKNESVLQRLVLHATARMYSRHELVSGLLIALYSDAIRCAFCDARLVDFIAP
jgi:hypothetical protein